MTSQLAQTSKDIDPLLVQLSSHVFVCEPTIDAAVDSVHPSVILLFGWMYAQASHLKRYVIQLRHLFSSSTIVLIKCADTSFYWASHGEQQRRILPVVDVIRDKSTGMKPFNGVLVHVLSNGGGFQLLELRRILAKMRFFSDENTRLAKAPIALILDSVPGANGLSSMLDVATPSQPVLKALTTPAVSAVYLLMYTINAVAGNPPIFAELRKILHATNTLALPSSSMPNCALRLYVYSASDKIVPFDLIEAHIDEAKRKGLDVSVEKFETSAHVSHARKDPERYWSAVERLWLKAVAESRAESTPEPKCIMKSKL